MKDFFDKLSPLTKLILVIIGLVLAYFLYKQISRFIKLRKEQFILGNATGTATIDGQPISINLGSVAQQIYDAFHDYYFGAFEDEETAITVISGVPKSLIPQLSSIYFDLYKLNLNSEYIKYLSPSDYKRVQNLFN